MISIDTLDTLGTLMYLACIFYVLVRAWQIPGENQ